jgi:nitrous oxide reductase accessory protein NosL
MKRLLIVLTSIVLALALCYGCGKKETEKPGKVPTEVKEAEMKDTTSMDTATMDTGMIDTGMTDTMKTKMKKDTM